MVTKKIKYYTYYFIIRVQYILFAINYREQTRTREIMRNTHALLTPKPQTDDRLHLK